MHEKFELLNYPNPHKRLNSFRNDVISTNFHFQRIKLMIDIPGEFHAYIINNKILTDRFNLELNFFNNERHSPDDCNTGNLKL